MIAFYDTECFTNYWLLKMSMGDLVCTFSLSAGKALPPEDCALIRQLFGDHTSVSFNGNHYDVPMITAALNGYTCEQLKWLNDQIIVQGLKPWELGLPEWKPKDHIDIMETLPGMGGQKMYAGRIHCKMMQDLPYSPDQPLTEEQITVVDRYCENDLSVLEELYDALSAQLKIREDMGSRYGVDLRSKSDAQCAEAVLKRRCEQAAGKRIYKPEINWNLKFRYDPPTWMSFQTEQMQRVFETVKRSVFRIGSKGRVEMPAELEGLEIGIGSSVYRMGIGGLHSQEKNRVVRSTETHILKDVDVASYYPSLMLNSGKFPKALGPQFLKEFEALKNERLNFKKQQKKLEQDGKKNSPEWLAAMSGNEGLKIFINGTFGKTGSPYSILFAPEMMIQTTITGQLALLMLIELLEQCVIPIPVVSANTDGLVISCPVNMQDSLGDFISVWESVTGLEMESGEYAAIYSRDINNYFAVKADGEVKRKGAYSKAGLIEKKSPDVEICGDAVAAFLSKGTPIAETVMTCPDIRKFVVVQKVAGGAVKLWGEGPHKDALVRDMVPVLTAAGWVKEGRAKWRRCAPGKCVKELGIHSNLCDPLDARTAYESMFSPQVPEYLGKVIRWYYATDAPGPIIYNKNGNTVGLSYGAKPCMVLPDEFPTDIDYDWYIKTCEGFLKDVGYGEDTEVPRPQ